MTYLFAILAGFLGAAVGWFLTAVATSIVATVLGTSNFEGAIGFLAVFGTGPIGGLVGLILGVVLVLRYRGGFQSSSAIVGRFAIILAAIAALVAAVIIFQLATLGHFTDGNPTMHFEIRMPVAMGTVDRKSISMEMQAGSQRSSGYFNDDWLRRDGESVVLSGFVPLYTRTSQRMFVLAMPDKTKLIFNIKLSATPAKSETFGAWQRVDFIDDGKPGSQPRRASSADNYEIRVRVPDWTVPYVQTPK